MKSRPRRSGAIGKLWLESVVLTRNLRLVLGRAFSDEAYQRQVGAESEKTQHQLAETFEALRGEARQGASLYSGPVLICII